MKRNIRTVPLGDSTRYHVTITDDPSSGPEIRSRQFAFLQDLVTNGIYQNLLHCGPKPFDKMEMYHDGGQWVVVMEGIDEPEDI